MAAWATGGARAGMGTSEVGESGGGALAGPEVTGASRGTSAGCAEGSKKRQKQTNKETSLNVLSGAELLGSATTTLHLPLTLSASDEDLLRRVAEGSLPSTVGTGHTEPHGHTDGQVCHIVVTVMDT